MIRKRNVVTLNREVIVDYKGEKMQVQWIAFPFKRKTLEGYKNETIKGIRVLRDTGKKQFFKKGTLYEVKFFEELYKIKNEAYNLFKNETNNEENEYINQVKALFSLWEKDIKEKKETALKEEKERKEKENREKAKENALKNWDKIIA